MRSFLASFSFFGVFLFSTTVAAAWTGPTLPPGCTSAGGSPPSCNTSAPLNVGTLSQVKNGSIGVNGLAVYGNSLLDWNVNGGGTLTYLNFSDLTSNPLTQSSGYGIRDNAGTLEFKNSGGSWQSLQAIVAGLGAGLWTQSGSSIYYTSGYVGIDTPSPSSALTVNGTITNSSSANNWWNSSALNIDGGNGTLYVHYLDDNSGNPNMALSSGQAIVYGDLTDYGGGYGLSIPQGGLNVAGYSIFSAGIGDNGQVGITGASNNWAEVINWAPPSSGAYYGLLVGTGPSGYSQFQNGSGYYSQLAYSSWGLYTNGNIYSGGTMQANAFYYNSDERLKKNIATIASSTALSDVLALRPVTYNWIDPSMGTTTQLGFIAQEVQQVVPQIVETNASTTMEAVDYARVTPLLVGSVQALDQTIEDQQQQINSQQTEIQQLQAEVGALLNK